MPANDDKFTSNKCKLFHPTQKSPKEKFYVNPLIRTPWLCIVILKTYYFVDLLSELHYKERNNMHKNDTSQYTPAIKCK